MIRKLAVILILSGFILILASQMNPTPEKVEWSSYERALELAREENKLIFVYFYSDSCEYCRAMSRNVFSDEHVVSILNKNFIPVKVDVMTDSALVKKFIPVFKEKKVYFVTPSYIILDSKERVVGIKNGYLEKKEFEIFIAKLINKMGR